MSAQCLRPNGCGIELLTKGRSANLVAVVRIEDDLVDPPSLVLHDVPRLPVAGLSPVLQRP